MEQRDEQYTYSEDAIADLIAPDHEVSVERLQSAAKFGVRQHQRAAVWWKLLAPNQSHVAFQRRAEDARSKIQGVLRRELLNHAARRFSPVDPRWELLMSVYLVENRVVDYDYRLTYMLAPFLRAFPEDA